MSAPSDSGGSRAVPCMDLIILDSFGPASWLVVSTVVLVLVASTASPPPQEEPAASRVARPAPKRGPLGALFAALDPIGAPPPGHKQVLAVLHAAEAQAAGTRRAHGSEGVGPRLGQGPSPPAPVDAALGWRPAPSVSRARRMTLVLDLDETLVHASSSPGLPARLHGGQALPFDLQLDLGPGRGGSRASTPASTTVYVWKRPHLDLFLAEAARYFELVVVTAGKRRYASPVIDAIDVRGLIRRRFFRDQCTAVVPSPSSLLPPLSPLPLSPPRSSRSPPPRTKGDAAACDAPGTAAAGDPAGCARSSPRDSRLSSTKYLKELKGLVAQEHWPSRAVLVDNSPDAYEHTCPRNAVPIRPW